MSAQTIEHLINFIYRGEVKVPADELNAFVHAAKSLQIKGLTETEKPNPQPVRHVRGPAAPPQTDHGHHQAKRQKFNSFADERKNHNVESRRIEQLNQNQPSTSTWQQDENNGDYYDGAANDDNYWQPNENQNDENNANYDYQGDEVDYGGEYSINGFEQQYEQQQQQQGENCFEFSTDGFDNGNDGDNKTSGTIATLKKRAPRNTGQ